MANAIQNFTPGGRAVAGYRPIASGLKQGKRDPATGIVYARPRVKIDNGLTSGGSVKIVNPRAMSGSVARRDRSLGIGGLVGDQTT